MWNNETGSSRTILGEVPSGRHTGAAGGRVVLSGPVDHVTLIVTTIKG